MHLLEQGFTERRGDSCISTPINAPRNYMGKFCSILVWDAVTVPCAVVWPKSFGPTTARPRMRFINLAFSHNVSELFRALINSLVCWFSFFANKILRGKCVNSAPFTEEGCAEGMASPASVFEFSRALNTFGGKAVLTSLISVVRAFLASSFLLLWDN